MEFEMPDGILDLVWDYDKWDGMEWDMAIWTTESYF
jgi:hypothetical protein